MALFVFSVQLLSVWQFEQWRHSSVWRHWSVSVSQSRGRAAVWPMSGRILEHLQRKRYQTALSDKYRNVWFSFDLDLSVVICTRFWRSRVDNDRITIFSGVLSFDPFVWEESLHPAAWNLVTKNESLWQSRWRFCGLSFHRFGRIA